MGSLQYCLAGHRGLGKSGAVSLTLPHAVPLRRARGPPLAAAAPSISAQPRGSMFSRAGIPAHQEHDAPCHTTSPWAMRSRDLPQLWQLLLFPNPCPLVMPVSPFRLALLQKVHPPLAMSRQQNHALWLNTGFFKSLTILIPIFLGIFFHTALSSAAMENKEPRAPACTSPVLMSNIICLKSLSPGSPSPSSLKVGLSLTLSIITCFNILSPVWCQARKSFSITETSASPWPCSLPALKTPEGSASWTVLTPAPDPPFPDPSLWWGCCLARGLNFQELLGHHAGGPSPSPERVFHSLRGTGDFYSPPLTAIGCHHLKTKACHRQTQTVTLRELFLCPQTNRPPPADPKEEPRLGENLSKLMDTQKAAPKVDIRAKAAPRLAPGWFLEPIPAARCLLPGCTSAASTHAGEQESITGLAAAGLPQGWRAAPAPAAAEHVAQHRRQPPAGPSPGLSPDVPLPHGEEAGEPLESHGMKALVNQGHASALLAPHGIYSALGAHPGGVQPLRC